MMAKKKKNLRRKKSNNLLKGAVTAGAVVGGGAIFQGNNVVYAAEMNSDSISDSGSTDIWTESMSASTTQSESVSIPTSTEESDTNFPAGIHRASRFNRQQINAINETGNQNEENQEENQNQTNENESISLSTSQSLSTSASNALSESEDKLISESEDASNSHSNAIEESNSVSDSMSASKSDSAKNYGSLSESASISLSTAESIFKSNSVSLSTAYSNAASETADVYNPTLQQLRNEIEDFKQRFEDTKKHGGNLTELSNQFTIALAKYYFYQMYGTGEISRPDGGWKSADREHNYERNNLYLKYTTSDNEEHQGFFDWVWLDKDGNHTENLKNAVDLQVVRKAPVYKSDSSKAPDKKFYSYKDANGQVHHMYAERIEKDGWHKEYSYEYKDVTNEVTVTENGRSTITIEYKNKSYNLSMDNSVYPEFGEVKDEYNFLHASQEEKMNGTTVKGSKFFSIKDFDDKQDKYAKDNSKFISVSEEQSDLIKESTSQSTSESESLSTSKMR